MATVATGSGEWVELRIHGVSGTPPEELLGHPWVVQVAGDDQRRIYRRAAEDGSPMGADADGRILEGYHWGNLTSGSWRQALWLLLIPFGMINTAQFMLPPAPRRLLRYDDPATHEGMSHRQRFATVMLAFVRDLGASLVTLLALVLHLLCGALLRFIGLAQTCILAFTAALICMEMAGRQWARTLGVGTTPSASSGVTIAPGVAITVGMVASMLAVVLLWWIGGALTKRPDISNEDRLAFLQEHTGLAVREFLSGDPSAASLRRLHLAAGWFVITLQAANVRSAYVENPGAAHLGTLGPVSAIGLAVVAVTVVLSGDLEGSASVTVESGVRRFGGVWRRRVAHLVSIVGLLAAGLVALLSAIRILGLAKISALVLPGLDGWANGLIAVNVGAVLALLVANAVLASVMRDTTPRGSVRDHFGRFAKGNATSLVTAVAVYLGLGFSAAFTYAAARLFGLHITDQLPGLVQRTAFAWGVTIVVVVVVIVVTLVARIGATVGWGGGPGPYLRRAQVDFAPRKSPTGAELSLPAGWLRRVAGAMWTARLKRRLPAVFVLFTFTGSLMSIVAGYAEFHRTPMPPPVGSFFVHRDLWGLLDDLSASSNDAVGWKIWMMWLGTTVLIVLAIWLIALGRGAVFKRNQRRVTSILWDVISFWPLSAHPFAPLPYSQVAVLQLRDRIRHHLAVDANSGHPTRPVVLAAHSQGSLIALTALLWLRPEERALVGFVTHGSQLQVAFSRGFPAYVNYGLITELTFADGPIGGGWVNLYRETDPIAGPVLSWSHWTSVPDDPSGLRSYSFGRLPGPDGKPGTDTIDPVTGRRCCGPDWRLLDPTPHDPALQTGAVARILGHSNYYADPDWETAIQAVRVTHVASGFVPQQQDSGGSLSPARASG